MNSEFFMWLTIAVNIIGWFIIHILSRRRDFSNKKKEIRLQYLIEAWQLLENASNRLTNKKNEDIETAIANIQLFGSPHQITLAQKFAQEISTYKSADTLPLLIELRRDLRMELGLSPVEDKFRFVRFYNSTK